MRRNTFSAGIILMRSLMVSGLLFAVFCAFAPAPANAQTCPAGVASCNWNPSYDFFRGPYNDNNCDEALGVGTPTIGVNPNGDGPDVIDPVPVDPALEEYCLMLKEQLDRGVDTCLACGGNSSGCCASTAPGTTNNPDPAGPTPYNPTSPPVTVDPTGGGPTTQPTQPSAATATDPPPLSTDDCPPGWPCTTAPDAAALEDPSTGPNASKAENNGACDANFMNQIYARAFMEAEREVISGSAIMLKPDSILEYTCFSSQASDQAGAIEGIFSADEGDLYGHVSGLVFNALTEYFDSNYKHDYLGGAYGSATAPPPGSGVCDVMYSVYHVAKCSDFGLEAPYMSFEEFANADPRALPRTCNVPHALNRNNKLLDLAKGVDNNDTADPDDDTYYVAFDRVDTLLERMRGTRGQGCEDDVPIRTGRIIYYRQYDEDQGTPVTRESYEYEDKVCLNPGCYFDNNGNADPNDDRCVP